MPVATQFINRIFSVSEEEFNSLAIEIFQFQAINNAIYAEFINQLGIVPARVTKIEHIPFLPIELFKNHKVVTGNADAEIIFESSGTTGQLTSKHYVTNLDLYHKSMEECFRQQIGEPKDLCILALLPSYLERNNASLVYMVRHLMELSGHPLNGFYLEILQSTIKQLQAQEQAFVLFGVTFALLDLVEKFPMPFTGGQIIETGGMKGRRKEMVREELHHILKQGFRLDNIYSEYGMTELLSQAYSKGNGIYHCPNWMKIMIRDPYDPFSYLDHGKTGVINVIDLANINSCSFIATQDIGKVNKDGSFEVLGRLDNAEVRGCNLMVM